VVFDHLHGDPGLIKVGIEDDQLSRLDLTSSLKKRI
jgi:hypothetical protein